MDAMWICLVEEGRRKGVLQEEQTRLLPWLTVARGERDTPQLCKVVTTSSEAREKLGARKLSRGLGAERAVWVFAAATLLLGNQGSSNARKENVSSAFRGRGEGRGQRKARLRN
jgi:hypothetical protein